VNYKFFFLFIFTYLYFDKYTKDVSGNCAITFYKVNIPNRGLHFDDFDISCQSHNSEDQSKCLTITFWSYWSVIKKRVF